jgi:hypothetical protein
MATVNICDEPQGHWRSAVYEVMDESFVDIHPELLAIFTTSVRCLIRLYGAYRIPLIE